MGFVSRVRILLGALLRNPLLPANMLVGGGFYVLAYTVEYGGLQSFAVPHVVELHGRFCPQNDKKTPTPAGVRVSLEIIL